MNDFSNGSAWAITPDAYEATAKNYQFFMSSPEMQREAAKFDAKTGEYTLDIRDGVAVVGIKGNITNRESFFSFLYGGAAIPRIKSELVQAVADRQVQSILLDIDSPGGTVPGVDDLSTYIAGLDIPVVAYTGGMMASAAMWIGSAANRIIVSKTADVGSIGVLMVHTDVSKMAEDDGIKFTVMRAGKYKAIGNPYEPLTGDSKGTVQAELDYLYSIFVDAVASNRGVSVDKALEMADGKIFIGQQAVDVGLADEIGTFETAFNLARSVGESAVQSFLLTGSVPGREINMADIKSVEELKAAFPDIVAQIQSDAIASVDTTGEVKTEVARVVGLAALQFGDDDGKFQALVDSGVTLEQFKAIKAMEPEKLDAPEGGTTPDATAQMLEQIKAAGAIDPGQGAADVDTPKTFTEAWKAIKKADPDLTTSQAMSQASADYPELYDTHRKGA